MRNPLLHRGRPLLGWLAAVLAAVALVLGGLGYLGYFGGPVFMLVPAAGERRAAVPHVAAVLLSGDAGFKVGMGPRIAARLAADGMPVVGVNSLTYFRTRRSPAENEALIDDAMHRALALPEIDTVVLIGQSFGADMLQAGLPRLPEAARRHVLLVALIVPGDTVDFRASPDELLNFEKADVPALPTARQLTWVPTLCIHGESESGSLCPLLRQPNVSRVTLPGGHMLNRDVDAVYAVLLRAIRDSAARFHTKGVKS